MLAAKQNGPVAHGLTMFPSGKYARWVEALFEAINIREAKCCE